MLATAIKNSIQEAQEKGKIEGKIEGKLDTVKKMLSKNYPVEEIAEVTGLSLEEIKKIK